MSWGIALLVFLFILVVLNPLIVRIRLSRFRLRFPVFSLIPEEKLPPEAVVLLKKARSWAENNRFVFAGYVQATPEIVGTSQGDQVAFFYCSDRSTWAVASVKPSPHPLLSWRMQFWTPVKGGLVLSTANLGDDPEEDIPPGFAYLDACVLTVDELAAVHFERFTPEDADPTWANCDLPGLIGWYNDQQKLLEERMLAEQRLIDLGDCYRVPFSQTGRYLDRNKAVLKQTGKLLKEAPVGYQPPVKHIHQPGSVESELRSYRFIEESMGQKKAPWMGKTSLLLLSVIVFAAAWGVSFGWVTVPIIIAVLLIHETGHLLGMKLFRYKNVSMLFIPMLGAAVTGTKKEATPWQEAIVLLLGPVPGLIIGILLWWLAISASLPAWVTEFAMMSVILNAFNLLPILPLDGGRLVDLALFNRFPKAKIVFDVLSVGALLFIAVTLDAWVLLAFSGLLAMTLWPGIKENLVMSRLVRSGAVRLSEEERTRAVIAAMMESPFARQEAALRHLRSQSLISRLNKAGISRLNSAGILAAWLVSLALPLIFSTLYAFAVLYSDFPETPEEWEARIAVAGAPSDKLSETIMAANMMYSNDDHEAAHRFMQSGLQMLESGEFDAVSKANALQSISGLPEDFTGLEQRDVQLRIIDWLKADNSETARYRLLDEYYWEGFRNIPDRPDEAQRSWQKMKSVIDTLPDEDLFSGYLLTDAVLHEVRGDFGMAEAIYWQSLEQATDSERSSLQTDLLAFLLRTRDEVAVAGILESARFGFEYNSETNAGGSQFFWDIVLILQAGSDAVAAYGMLAEHDFENQYDDTGRYVTQLYICYQLLESECVAGVMKALDSEEHSQYWQYFLAAEKDEQGNEMLESGSYFTGGYLYHFQKQALKKFVQELEQPQLMTLAPGITEHWLFDAMNSDGSDGVF
jgi:Zn-dependent protease